jgi:hypothetical protein
MEEEPKQNSVTDEDSKDFKLRVSQSDEITIEITRQDFIDFIDDEANTYFTKFRKFYADGRDKFAFTWNWSAFFFTSARMAWRKLYGWALVVFFLSYVPFLFHKEYYTILLMPVLGLTGNYLYYKHTKKKILNLKTTQTFSDSTQMSNALHKIGGVNVRAAFVVVLLRSVFQALYRFMLAQ